jgi:hypothetical protein
MCFTNDRSYACSRYRLSKNHFLIANISVKFCILSEILSRPRLFMHDERGRLHPSYKNFMGESLPRMKC